MSTRFTIEVEGSDAEGWRAYVHKIKGDKRLPVRRFSSDKLAELMDAQVLGYMLGYES